MKKIILVNVFLIFIIFAIWNFVVYYNDYMTMPDVSSIEAIKRIL